MAKAARPTTGQFGGRDVGGVKAFDGVEYQHMSRWDSDEQIDAFLDKLDEWCRDHGKTIKSDRSYVGTYLTLFHSVC